MSMEDLPLISVGRGFGYNYYTISMQRYMHTRKMYMYRRKEAYKTRELRESLYILLIETIFHQYVLFLCRKISGIYSKNISLYKEFLHGDVHLNSSLRETWLFAATNYLSGDKGHCYLE